MWSTALRCNTQSIKRKKKTPPEHLFGGWLSPPLLMSKTIFGECLQMIFISRLHDRNSMCHVFLNSNFKWNMATSAAQDMFDRTCLTWHVRHDIHILHQSIDMQHTWHAWQLSWQTCQIHLSESDFFVAIHTNHPNRKTELNGPGGCDVEHYWALLARQMLITSSLESLQQMDQEHNNI